MSKIIAREPVVVEDRKSFTPKQRLQALLKSNGCCAVCSVKLTRYDVDHIKARGLGGLHVLENWQAICPLPVGCHADKTKVDRRMIDKAKRQSKMNDPREPSRLQGRGFDKTRTRRFDGTVVARKAA